MRTARHLSSDIRHLTSENDEEAAEELRHLLAFGPRIRRGAGGEDRIRDSAGVGTGTRPVPRVRSTGGGDGCRRDAPNSFNPRYARPSGSAMNRVWSPDLTRIST